MDADKPRVYAFIDSQNLNLGVQKLGWKMDWRKFRKFLADCYGVTKAYMFIGYIPEFEFMYEQMHDLGYAVVLKPTFDLTRPRPELVETPKELEYATHRSGEHEEKKPVKGNIDAELVLWAMKEMSNYDKAIIVSGDGDFFCLVEYLEQKKRLLHLLAPSGHYSSLYNIYEDYIVRIDQFRRELAYRDRPRGNRARSEQNR
ncbi:MAG TPA: NYN domain-containing protein [Candidatus Saccharimonadales bacterium]|nr:NYN domain-containing protein [Candidatus Saccharimonadales bacterium]